MSAEDASTIPNRDYVRKRPALGDRVECPPWFLSPSGLFAVIGGVEPPDVRGVLLRLGDVWPDTWLPHDVWQRFAWDPAEECWRPR